MVARQLGADSDGEDGRNVQINLIFSLEAEDLQLEAEDLQLEVEDVCLRARLKLETLSHQRKQVSTFQLKRYPAENQSEA